MALHYDLAKVSDEAKHFDNQRTTDMIFSTMAVGLGDITEANHREYYTRLQMLGIYDDLTLEVVRSFIGLHTNVSNETEAAFNKRLVRTLRQRVKDELWRVDNARPSVVTLD